MNHEEMHASLDALQEACHSQFKKSPGRMPQLDGVVETLKMIVDHLFDEDARHPDPPEAPPTDEELKALRESRIAQKGEV